MTDRELLETAAKAAGIAWDAACHSDIGLMLPTGGKSWARQWQVWNPLTNDGDALRLAVKLGIGVEFGYCEDDAPVLWTHHELLGRSRYPNFPDPYAATRRAIVRAAAAIGKEQP